jgi:hypothetical protein
MLPIINASVTRLTGALLWARTGARLILRITSRVPMKNPLRSKRWRHAIFNFSAAPSP